MVKGTDYFIAFAKLHTDRNMTRWPAITTYRAPYKPFMLLAVMDLIAQHAIKTNLVQFTAELLDVFDLYWSRVMGPDKNSNPILPFYHLQSDGFWTLVPVPGMEQVLATTSQIRTLSQLHQVILGARLNDELFSMLCKPRERDELRRVLIETYFAPEIRPVLVEVGVIAAESFQYSLELFNHTRDRFKLVEDAPEVEERYHTEARSTAFRRVVVDAYNHTCALCGIRILTPEGRTAVAAAHIVPWSVSHNDDPRNGLALCGLHHWTFDQGLIGISPDFHINISPVIIVDDDAIRPLLVLADHDLHQPTEALLQPAKEALHWHFKKIFRGEYIPRLI